MALKVNTPSNPTGSTPVNGVDFRAGMVAALNPAGQAVLAGSGAAASTNTPENKAVGLFGDDRLTASLRDTAQVNEQVPLTSGVAVALAHSSIVPNSQRVTLANGTLLVVGVDYTFNASAGTITSLGTQPNGTVVNVTYTFQLATQTLSDFIGVNFRGSNDDTQASGQATVWKGFGEFETDQYVTSQSYAVGDQLRYTHASHALGAGLLTNEAAGSTVVNVVVARVIKPPTAASPFLGFEWLGSPGF
jgi:hypothetical protein